MGWGELCDSCPQAPAHAIQIASVLYTVWFQNQPFFVPSNPIRMRVLGLMSGTSVDAIDIAVADIQHDNGVQMSFGNI